ncbi:MAG: hypothetical protein KBD01_14525 [Acidobacteria bacterium]|nr:hypothetical protein [Acidobacteriota bacterium]
MTRIGTVLAILALFAFVPASANVISSAELDVGCQDYTLTISGDDFAALDACIPFSWQVVLEVGSINSMDLLSLTGSGELCPQGDTPNPSITIRNGWPAGGASAYLPGFNPGGTLGNWPGNLADSYFAALTYGALRGTVVLWDDTYMSAGNGLNVTVNGLPTTDAFGQPLANPPSFGNCPPPQPPVIEICRDADFWGTHAGNEGSCRAPGRNLTLELVSSLQDKDLDVCGKILVSTKLWSRDSVLEGLCSTPFFDDRVELARHLSATALNCAISAGTDDCTGVSIKPLFDECNATCMLNNDRAQLRSCAQRLDCYNKGGLWNGSRCQVGTCGGDGVTACASDWDCPRKCRKSVKCVPLPDTCASEPLANPVLGINFEPVGAPSSAGSCFIAHFDLCTIFGGCGKDGGCGH